MTSSTSSSTSHTTQTIYNPLSSLTPIPQNTALQGFLNQKVEAAVAAQLHAGFSFSSSSFSEVSFEERYRQAKSDEQNDLVCAFQRYEALAQAGYGPAMIEVAFFLCQGIVVQIDYSRAVLLAQEAFLKGLDLGMKGRALCILGIAHEEGYWKEGVLVKNQFQAKRFYQDAYKLGDLFGGCLLSGLYYRRGKKTREKRSLTISFLS